MKIEFLPEAKAELDDAVEYYELQLKGLGMTFKDVARSTIKRVATFPTAWTTMRPSIRRFLVFKFLLKVEIQSLRCIYRHYQVELGNELITKM